MQNFFNQLADSVFQNIQGDEWCELYLSSEDTDFVRINNSKIRQPGNVKQHYLTVRLGKESKKLSTTMTISKSLQDDQKRIVQQISGLRAELPQIPDDPYMVQIKSSERSQNENNSNLPSSKEVLDAFLTRAKNVDLVGLYTSGTLSRGFASSFGQRNWFSSSSFQLDWSLFREQDNALKSSLMGKTWDAGAFERKWQDNMNQFEMLMQPRQTLDPGKYRVYLSPTAMNEIIGLLSWGGFGIRNMKNKVSPLIKLAANEEHFHPSVQLSENVGLGIAPTFNSAGDAKPGRTNLIVDGKYATSLVSSRSSKEFQMQSNGAEESESPTSIEIASGKLKNETILSQLHTGLYINNLWYMNYSDRKSCRTTGMTRFATFWVENGKIQRPVKVIRFDENLFKALGSNLEGLTQEQELILSSDTYGERKASCTLLPGALINDFNFCQ